MEERPKRLGAAAVEKGFITREQLLTAMNIQIMEDIERGNHRRLGRILCELGIMSPGQIDELLVLLSAWRNRASDVEIEPESTNP